MSIISTFLDKSLSLLRMGCSWFGKLVASLIEAGRTISYVETVNPSQSDSLHNAIKWSDEHIIRRQFEICVRSALKKLGFDVVKVAIDCTEDPYWGKNGLFNTRAKVHEKSDESWQYVNLSIVEPHFIPLMSLPYRQTDNLDTLTIDLLEYLKALPLKVNLVLFDRGFYHAHLIDYLENRRGKMPWPYLILVPKNKAMKRYIEQTNRLGVFDHEFKYLKEMSSWKPKTRIVICKGASKNKDGKPIDWCFATNQKPGFYLVREYRKRWNIETGFRIHDEAKIKSKSSHPLIRYFYHLLSMLIILTWRLYNHFNPYIVFKRYLKLLEQDYTAIMKEPPPHRRHC